jgi:hypothetical protein
MQMARRVLLGQVCWQPSPVVLSVPQEESLCDIQVTSG